jgi:hypothetical protein
VPHCTFIGITYVCRLTDECTVLYSSFNDISLSVGTKKYNSLYYSVLKNIIKSRKIPCFFYGDRRTCSTHPLTHKKMLRVTIATTTMHVDEAESMEVSHLEFAG